jgi:hypothetical protein
MFVGTEAYLRVVHLKGAPLTQAPSVLAYIIWKGFPLTNTSVLVPFISYEGSSVLNTTPCGLYYKHMTIVNDDSSIII